MSDPSPLSTVETTVLSEGIKFLYSQAAEVLRRWRQRRDEPPEPDVPDDTADDIADADTDADTGDEPVVLAELPDAFVPSPVRPGLDEQALDRLADELWALRRELQDYVDGVMPVDPSDSGLLGLADGLRRCLEVIWRRPLVFQGERRASAEERALVEGRVEVGEVAGYAAAIRVAAQRAGTIRGWAQADRVAPGGRLLGVDLGSDTSPPPTPPGSPSPPARWPPMGSPADRLGDWSARAGGWPDTDVPEPFVGRQWTLARIDRWLAAGQSGRFLLGGEPGAGKSRLAQRLVELSDGTVPPDALRAFEPGTLAVVHVCRADDDRTQAPLRVIESLAGQLAARFSVFQTALTAAAHPVVQIRIEHVEQHVEQVAPGGLVAGVVVHIDGIVPARAAFDQLLRRPLEALVAEQPQQIVLLIDALDETLDYPDPVGLVGLLAEAALPRQVRLLLTSRSDPRVTEALGRPDLDLITDQPDGVDDVHAYALARLTGPQVPAALDDARRRMLAAQIAAAGKGNFLYARYVLDELLADSARLTHDPVPLELPDGLTGIYAAFLKRELGRRGSPAREQRWREVYRPLLGALAVAHGDGLTRAQLADITGLARSQVDDALRAVAQYLALTGHDGPVRIYHQSFRDFLVADGPHCVYGDEANAALTDALIRRVPPRHDSPDHDWLAADAYTRTHLATHAAKAGRLDDLLDDPRFLVAADLDRLLPVLDAARSPSARQTAGVYWRTVGCRRGDRSIGLV